MAEGMMRRAALVVAAIMAAIPCPTPATAGGAGDFIQGYVDAKGGCHRLAPLLVFENGVASARAPFGKPAEDWTDDDLAALRRAMDACVRAPNRFDLGEERTILSKVGQRVSEARAARVARERQAVAARETAENARRQQQVDDASRELQTFGGHVMSPAEVERAGELLDQFPNLSDDINDLLGAQDGLKQKASEERQREQERVAAAQRIAAEKQRADEEAERQRQQQVLDAKLHEEEAKAEAIRQRRAFLWSLPDVCKAATAIDAELHSPATQDRFGKALQLAMAGETKEVCALFPWLTSKREAARAGFVACAKALENSPDKESRDFASNALEKAIDLHVLESKRDSESEAADCR